MDFDEYDYLEKTVENPDGEKVKETVNGGDVKLKSGDDKHVSRSSRHKSDDRDDDVERRSKRSKLEDESRERSSRHGEKVSLRHRSRSRDRDRDRRRSSKEYRGRDERERNQEERSTRDVEKERELERGHDRDRDKESRRGRDGERDREREHARRSRSESERRHGDRDEIVTVREKSQDNEFKGRERVMEAKERARDGRRYKDKKEDATEPEPDPERDQRTVFAYQICLKATERDVYEFFSKAGKVRDVRLIMDRNSRRSKGVGYVEFVDAMSVPMAIALSGQTLLSQPVMVKPSEAEKNQVQSTSATGSGGVMGPYSGGARRLYVGNLHPNITEDNLRQVFGAFGAVELVQLPIDETGHCKGFGFIQFSRLEDSRNALSLNGQLEIAGRTIKVSTVTDQPGAQDMEANTGDLDDEDGAGLSLNASSRAFLMQKLDRTGTASSIAGSLGAPVVNNTGLALPMTTTLGVAPIASSLVTPLATIPAFPGLGAGLQVPTVTANLLGIGAPSECLLLKNMFDPTAESEPNFDLDIRDDVEEECSRFGKLKHIYVDKNSSGFVYLRFENSEAAMNAQRALNGRWFAGKMIGATFMDIPSYEAKFPESG